MMIQEEPPRDWLVERWVQRDYPEVRLEGERGDFRVLSPGGSILGQGTTKRMAWYGASITLRCSPWSDWILRGRVRAAPDLQGKGPVGSGNVLVETTSIPLSPRRRKRGPWTPRRNGAWPEYQGFGFFVVEIPDHMTIVKAASFEDARRQGEALLDESVCPRWSLRVRPATKVDMDHYANHPGFALVAPGTKEDG